jgi:hypothetical protein
VAFDPDQHWRSVEWERRAWTRFAFLFRFRLRRKPEFLGKQPQLI